MNKTLQCKHIDDKIILTFLAKWQGSCCTNFDDVENSIIHCMKDTPYKLRLTKMKSLIRRGLVEGCACGCRGDFEITDEGLEVIGQPRTREMVVRPSGYLFERETWKRLKQLR